MFTHSKRIQFAVQKRPYTAQRDHNKRDLMLHKRGCMLHKRDLMLHKRDSQNHRPYTMRYRIGAPVERIRANPVALHTSRPKEQTALFTESKCSGNPSESDSPKSCPDTMVQLRLLSKSKQSARSVCLFGVRSPHSSQTSRSSANNTGNLLSSVFDMKAASFSFCSLLP